MIKGIISFSILVFLVSCTEYEKTDFVIKNEYSSTITVQSSAYVRSTNGSELVSYTDYINTGSELNMRTIEVSENVDIEDVFHSLDIYNDKSIKTTKNVFDKTIWNKNSNKYVLTVDSTYFK